MFFCDKAVVKQPQCPHHARERRTDYVSSLRTLTFKGTLMTYLSRDCSVIIRLPTFHPYLRDFSQRVDWSHHIKRSAFHQRYRPTARTCQSLALIRSLKSLGRLQTKPSSQYHRAITISTNMSQLLQNTGPSISHYHGV